jgi:hypothetical protein
MLEHRQRAWATGTGAAHCPMGVDFRLAYVRMPGLNLYPDMESNNSPISLTDATG